MFKQRYDVIEDIRVELGSLRPAISRGVILLCDEVEGESMTKGGVVLLASEAKDVSYIMATVISVQDDVYSLGPGDRVVVGKFYGKEIPHENDGVCKMKLVTDDQIEAVLE
jgi:co-chaperonin GroES (HSP10)